MRLTRWIAVPLVASALLLAVVEPLGAQPMRSRRAMISPVDQVLLDLRQLEMTPFLTPRSRMALTEARFEMQTVAWRAQRGFVSPFDLDRVAARLAFVARDPNLTPFDRMQLQQTAWTLHRLRLGATRR